MNSRKYLYSQLLFVPFILFIFVGIIAIIYEWMFVCKSGNVCLMLTQQVRRRINRCFLFLSSEYGQSKFKQFIWEVTYGSINTTTSEKLVCIWKIIYFNDFLYIHVWNRSDSFFALKIIPTIKILMNLQ